MHYFRNTMIAALIPLLGAGCAYESHESTDNTFPGVRAAMQDSPVVCLLFVHGMGGYSAGDPATLVASIKSSLNLRTAHGGEAQPIGGNDDLGAATLTREHLVSDSGHELLAYTLNWEPIATTIKDRYLAYDRDPKLAGTRLSLDEAIREQLMCDRLSDVVIYAGVGKVEIQKSVREALKIMQQDAEGSIPGGKQYRYVIVTWSLGSKIVFDCLGGTELATLHTAADDIKFKRIARHTDAVFMLANQLPLLAMANTSPATQPATPHPVPESLQRFIETRNSTAAGETAPTRHLSIVAVSDPNDVLSYPIAPWLAQHDPNVEFSNVCISVAHWAAYLPVPFGGGWIANPETAHTGYGSNKEVMRLIIEGSP